MKKNLLVIIISILFLIYLFDNFFVKSFITGTYISNNTTPVIDGPANGDTLILFDNYTFKSKTWGNGKYSLDYSLTGTRINIQYKYEFGTAGFAMIIKRNYFVAPKLIFDIDQDYYFKKIK